MAIATADTADLIKVDQAHLIHPLYHPTEHETPKIWVKGNGAVMTDVEPVVPCPEEEMAGIQECEYCGHAPCGCGG